MEPDVSNLLSVAQAIEIIDAVPVHLTSTRVVLQDACGLRLAQAICADRDYPPFDKSLMDGFAVRAIDVAMQSVTLRLTGEVAAGSTAGVALSAGECVSIFTGAPIPAGADAVIPVELLTSRSSDSVTLRGPAKRGQNIAPRGSDCRAHEMLLRSGQVLTPAAVAVAASVGASQLDVYARACVAVLSSGDELIASDQPPVGSQIRNSNSVMLAALLRRLGCDVSDRGWTKDDPVAIRAAIESALRACDALFVAGGMSMGEYDFVPRVLGELGVELKITKLKIKPGKPFVFGVLRHPAGTKFIFGLPGNPVSGFVSIVRLCSRLLCRMSGGQAMDSERWVSGAITADLPANGPREFYQPAILRGDGTIEPLAWKGSADIYTLASANALLKRDENEPRQSAGTTVRVLLIP